MQKKRIAHFIDTRDPGGAEQLVQQLCIALKQEDYQPLLLHFDHPLLGPEFSRLGLDQLTVPGYRNYKSWLRLPVFIGQFARFLRQQNVSLLHSHLFGPVTAGAVATRLVGIPHVGTLHDRYTIDEQPRRINALQFSALLGTRLVVVSNDMAERLSGLSRFCPGGLRTIYNGVQRHAMSDSERLSVRESLKLDSEAAVLICVGRLVEIKAHEVLFNALSLLPTDLPFQLLVVGDGPKQEVLQGLVSELGLGEKVRFLGMRDDVPSLLCAADVFVLSSRSEGLSLSIVEALAAGLPAVVTDVGGNAELVKDRGNGFLVPADTPEALASALLAILQDPSLWSCMGQASQAIAQEKFSLNAMVESYLVVYRELLDE